MSTETSSPEYLAAIEAHNQAQRAFDKVRAAYREGSIGDDEFLKARDAMTEASEAFDTAFDREARRTA